MSYNRPMWPSFDHYGGQSRIRKSMSLPRVLVKTLSRVATLTSCMRLTYRLEVLVRIAAFVLLSMFGTLAYADEHFEFHRLTCNKAASEIKIEPVRLWNLQDKIWGDDTWTQHVALMKALEKDHQLYVFDKDYGYYDDQKEIVSRCGAIVARIVFEYYKKKMKAPKEPREIRINPLVWLYTNKGRAVASNPMWRSTESGMNAYGLSMNDKSTEIVAYRVKLSEDPADVTCCFPRAPPR